MRLSNWRPDLPGFIGSNTVDEAVPPIEPMAAK